MIATARPAVKCTLRIAAEPTHFLPGTPMKLRVMMQRETDGEEVCHPDDATGDGEWATLSVTGANGWPEIIFGQINQRTKEVIIERPFTRLGDAGPELMAKLEAAMEYYRREATPTTEDEFASRDRRRTEFKRDLPLRAVVSREQAMFGRCVRVGRQDRRRAA